MRFCHACGEKVGESSSFCMACGAQMSSPANRSAHIRTPVKILYVWTLLLASAMLLLALYQHSHPSRSTAGLFDGTPAISSDLLVLASWACVVFIPLSLLLATRRARSILAAGRQRAWLALPLLATLVFLFAYIDWPPVRTDQDYNDYPTRPFFHPSDNEIRARQLGLQKKAAVASYRRQLARAPAVQQGLSLTALTGWYLQQGQIPIILLGTDEALYADHQPFWPSDVLAELSTWTATGEAGLYYHIDSPIPAPNRLLVAADYAAAARLQQIYGGIDHCGQPITLPRRGNIVAFPDLQNAPCDSDPLQEARAELQSLPMDAALSPGNSRPLPLAERNLALQWWDIRAYLPAVGAYPATSVIVADLGRLRSEAADELPYHLKIGTLADAAKDHSGTWYLNPHPERDGLYLYHSYGSGHVFILHSPYCRVKPYYDCPLLISIR